MPALTPRRAFTLIEALIAAALGTVVVAVAFAGLRAASSAFTAMNRMATETGLLRAGMLAALDEVDTWRACDDPASGRTALRAVARPPRADFPLADGLGLPFTPMADVWHDSEWLPGRWDGSSRAWSASRQAARWRGNLAETADTDCRFGRYALFFDQFQALTIPAYDHHSVRLDAYGAVEPAETWWCQQFRGLASALGYYGLIDYLPANAICGAYGRFFPDGAPTGWYEDWGLYPNAGGIASEWLIGGYGAGYDSGSPWGTKWKLHPWVDSNRTARSRYRATLSAGFAVSTHPGFAAHWAARQPRSLLYADGGALDIPRFIDEVGAREDLLSARPAHWPAVDSTVLRYVLVGRFYNLAIVRLASPLSGQRVQLSFTCFGTTLRGARQQRGLDRAAGAAP